MSVGDGERHELFERDTVLGIDVEQRGRDGGEAKTLLHDLDRGEECCGDRLLGHALLAHRLEGAKLVEGVERRAFDVLGQRQLVDEDVCVGVRYDAGHVRGLGEALVLDEQLQRTEAASTGRHFIHAGVPSFDVEYGPDVKGLDEAAPRDRLGEFLDRDAGLDAADVRLAQHQLVEGDVPRRRQGDLLNGSCHETYSATGAESLSLDPKPVTKRSAALSL
ncbi:hypothetical protein BN961_04029 [Afipia felis]|uniref:Uncharacterized protein n=1 Tax=Afipia felis TaxID=1035 RepID=A0A090MWE7_AFIFE|nr:hypothetical protein BN961_04029 [Afipia felis]